MTNEGIRRRGVVLTTGIAAATAGSAALALASPALSTIID
jgi:hypothetical protein